MEIRNVFIKPRYWFNAFFVFLIPLGDLFIRCWVAKAFVDSGLSKTANWGSTLALFQYEYQVPYLSPQIAAVMAASIELGVSTLLILGLGGRLPALILFLYNIIVVVSYPVLWTSTDVSLNDHIGWGIVLLVILLHGTGKLSLDELLKFIFGKK